MRTKRNHHNRTQYLARPSAATNLMKDTRAYSPSASPGRSIQLMRIDANSHDAAPLHDVEAQGAGASQQLGRLGTGIEPDFLRRLVGDLFDHFKADFWRKVDG